MTDDKTKREIALQDYSHQSSEAMARLQYQVDYSKALLNGLTVGNGGAILAILTFIGNTGSKVDPANMQGAFGIYGTGLALVLAAYACGFFTQYFYYDASQNQAWNAQAEALGGIGNHEVARPMRRGNICLAVGIVVAVGSLACFIFGSSLALTALT